MEKSKDLSGRYILVGAILGFVMAAAVVMTCVLPLMRYYHHEPPDPSSKRRSITEVHEETGVLIASACIAAIAGMVAAHKIFLARQQRAAQRETNSPSAH